MNRQTIAPHIPPSRHTSAPCPPKGWWSWHVLQPFCSLPAQRMAVLARLRLFCSLPTQRMVAPAHSAASLLLARPRDGSPDTFCSPSAPCPPKEWRPGTVCGFSAPCPPKEWRPWHGLRLFCSLPTQRMAALARSAAFLLPAHPKNGGPGTLCSFSVPCTPEEWRP